MTDGYKYVKIPLKMRRGKLSTSASFHDIRSTLCRIGFVKLIDEFHEKYGTSACTFFLKVIQVKWIH